MTHPIADVLADAMHKADGAPDRLANGSPAREQYRAWSNSSVTELIALADHYSAPVAQILRGVLTTLAVVAAGGEVDMAAGWAINPPYPESHDPAVTLDARLQRAVPPDHFGNKVRREGVDQCPCGS